MKIIAVIRYGDPMRAAEWLRDAFGFRIDSVSENPPGSIDYISLGYGESILLLGQATESGAAARKSAPDQTDDQSCYLMVADIKDHFARAVAHGADVTINPEEPGQDGEFYVCRDLEGHLWSFGTHDFTSGEHAAAATHAPSPPATVPAARRGASIPLLVYTALVAAGITAGALLVPLGGNQTLATLLGGNVMGGNTSVETTAVPAMDRLRSQIADLERERKTLMGQVEHAQTRESAATAARGESEQALSKSLRDLEDSRKSSETLARESGAKLKSLTAKLDEATASLDWERASKKKIDAALLLAIGERDAADKEVRRLKQAVAALEGANRLAIDRAADVAADRTSAIRDLEAKRDQLARELSQRTSDLETERAARAEAEGTARAETQRLSAELEDLRQSHEATLEALKAQDEKRVAALNRTDIAIADAAKQTVAGQDDVAAVDQAATVTALQARIKELETSNKAASSATEAEKRLKLELAAREKLIRTLSEQLKKSHPPAKAGKIARPVRSKPAKPAPTEIADSSAADDVVFEDDPAAMDPERVRRCSRNYYNHC